MMLYAANAHIDKTHLRIFTRLQPELNLLCDLACLEKNSFTLPHSITEVAITGLFLNTLWNFLQSMLWHG